MDSYKYSESDIKAAATHAAQKLGYIALKDQQLEVIVGFVTGHDVFGVLPTGFGKSLCYACLPGLYDQLLQPEETSIVCVVTPLTAIIEDQVTHFSSRGLSVASITSNTSESMKQGVRLGEYQLVFFTPELLLEHKKWRRLLSKECYIHRVKAFVVDEAHCVKKWGETFRSVLLRIGEIRSLLPDGVHMMALTATATRTLQVQVANILGMHRPLTVAITSCKSNLVYGVSSYTSIAETFMPILKKLRKERVATPRMIIYCRRYEDCSNLYLFFSEGLEKSFTEPIDAPDLSRFRLVEMYTSCTDEEVKSQILKSFSSESPLRIVCATVAFGMGVDCPDVRQVIHFGAPSDTESYIQETGRAGRDGKPSLALLIKKKRATIHVDKSMIEYQQNSEICRRDFLYRDIDDYKHLDLGSACQCCDICAISCKCGLCKEKCSLFQFI